MKSSLSEDSRCADVHQHKKTISRLSDTLFTPPTTISDTPTTRIFFAEPNEHQELAMISSTAAFHSLKSVVSGNYTIITLGPL